jgi:hypothetical protein
MAVPGPPGHVPDECGERRREEHDHHERRDGDAERDRETHLHEGGAAGEHERREGARKDEARRGDRRPGVAHRHGGGGAGFEAFSRLFPKARDHQDVVVGAERDDEEVHHDGKDERQPPLAGPVLEDEDRRAEGAREAEPHCAHEVPRRDGAAQQESEDEQDQDGGDREHEGVVVAHRGLQVHVDRGDAPDEGSRAARRPIRRLLERPADRRHRGVGLRRVGEHDTEVHDGAVLGDTRGSHRRDAPDVGEPPPVGRERAGRDRAVVGRLEEDVGRRRRARGIAAQEHLLVHRRLGGRCLPRVQCEGGMEAERRDGEGDEHSRAHRRRPAGVTRERVADRAEARGLRLALPRTRRPERPRAQKGDDGGDQGEPREERGGHRDRERGPEGPEQGDAREGEGEEGDDDCTGGGRDRRSDPGDRLDHRRLGLDSRS